MKNNKNNGIYRKNNNNNKQKGKRIMKHKVYTYVIKTAIVNYVTPTYTEQNLKFLVYNLLRATSVFTTLKNQYTEYKLDKVTFFSLPRAVNGTDPAPCWIYLDTKGDDLAFNYVGMEELQGSKRLPVKHFSMTTFSSTGRQNDFHYWYDVTDETQNLAIRLHSEALPNNTKFWQFQIGFIVKFRGFVIHQGLNNNLANQIDLSKEQIVKISESQVEKVQGVQTELEEEEQAWNHIDSDIEEEGQETHGGDSNRI